MEFPYFNRNPYYTGPGVSNQCKAIIRKLLHKDESKRLGAHAGASEVKSHAFFKSINFALLRNMTPPIIPTKSKAIDAVHFRNMKESNSFDLERHCQQPYNQSSSPPSPPITDDDDEEEDDTTNSLKTKKEELKDPFADFGSGT